MNKNGILYHWAKKKTYLFLILSIFYLSQVSLLQAAEVDMYMQEKIFTVKMENKTVKEILRNIEEDSEFIFMYANNLLHVLEKKVSIQVENNTIVAIMEQLSKEAGINFEIKGRQIILSQKQEKLQREKSINVNGTVWDEQGNPLPGVNVVVKSTNIGTTTDIDGNYFLSVPSKSSVLTFSYIGFEPKEVTVGGLININVNLKEVSTSLNEVVVVGFGSQKRESVVGSITTISPDRLQQSPTRA